MSTVFANHLDSLVNSCKTDSESVFNTWFIGSEERLKAFRTIRRGVATVVEDINLPSWGEPWATMSPSRATTAALTAKERPSVITVSRACRIWDFRPKSTTPLI